ncbi:ankyrin repeat-containing domain protein [Rhodocollybia butyracea]|uniref:Ankyrin repeat-containing domain protein n=1 Tax=Rhodocollybia butyracea TaxID=206335 RepID=A0A9P5U1D7_9AGAR|nr:ankyrin repeat-containing domain protein [Rhodocollybia butyracea]
MIKKTAGTGEWILSDSEYVEWHEGEPGILWIQGKVGSGKTMLSTTIIKNLQDNSAVGCYYYYFDNRDNLKTKTTARGLLLSLLLQMATTSDSVHPALHAQFTKCNNQGVMEPTTEDLSITLAAIVKDLTPAFLVLDAMDECSEAIDVFRHLAHFRNNLYIAVTSRYLAEPTYNDVFKYLQDKLGHRKLKQELFDEIGQFRWVDCQVTVLQRCKTPKAIQEALKKMPKSLEETYTVAIKRISESEHVDDAGQLLRWLTYALEPLSIAQVTEILAVDLDEQIFDPEARSLELETGVYDILDSTLIVVNVNNIVQLAHNSVKEFFMARQGEHLAGLIEINEHLANSKQIYDFEKDYPLSAYAAKYWPSHMRRLAKEQWKYQPAHDLAVRLVRHRSELPYMNWIKIYECNPKLEVDEIQPPLYYMAYEGLAKIVQELLEETADVNTQGGEYGNALQAAAAQGNGDIIQLLLEHKADANVQGGWYGNALQAAVAGGYRDIVQLLLEHKADANAQGRMVGNPLQVAVAQGNKDIVQLLLEHKADGNAQGGRYGNVLCTAAAEGNKDIVQLLLEHKADPNAQGGPYGNALYIAAAESNKDIVQLLLKYKADANTQGGHYGNALQAAVAEGSKNIVQLLLEHKADANTQGGHYGNALQAAVAEGSKDIVQLLLEHKADANAQGGHYGNALQAAVGEGSKDIVQLLLEHKADANAQGGHYGNALQAAAARGKKDIVQLLLEHKADANAQGGHYGNALQAAAAQHNKYIVQLLLEHKADVNAKGGDYGNALQAASAEGNKAIVQLLLEYKADVNAQGGHYGNALQAAAAEGHKVIVQLLLEHKADANAQGGEYGNVLQAAAAQHNKYIVQLLLEHKAKANAQDGDYGN